jgi:tetratricopeptide (TPR) repeat protein
VRAEPDIHVLFPREEPALNPIPKPEVKQVGSEHGSLRAVASVDSDRHPTPYKISTPEPVETPVVTENHSPVVPPAVPQPHHPSAGVNLEGLGDNIAEVPDVLPPVAPPVVARDSPQPSPPSVPPATPSPDPVNGVSYEGWDNIMEDPEVKPEPVTIPVVKPTPVPSAPSGHGSVQLEGMDNIAGESDAPNASGPSEWLTPTNKDDYSRSLPLLREIKERLEQATEGKIERIPHPDQSSISLSIPRWTMRLLMSAASLVPSAFASHSGFLGPVESTPYYPTGDLSRHRATAFSTAIDCIDDLEAHITGGDDVRNATKLVALAQALSDLGLHDYALTTSGFALNALQRPYTAEPNNARLRVASALSLRANILCDRKKNEEANDAAERAVTLCREHKKILTAPVPELTYALLNHAVILNAIDLKEGSAAVAFELLGELDESQPETNNVLALCKLCVSTSRIGDDDDMATSMADETIDLTRMSLDVNSQTVLAAALLAKSKALSSKDQNEVASTVSAEAVTLLRGMSVARPVFSLFLAHALDTHAHHLWGSNRKGESYSVRQDAVEQWQTVKATAGGAVARPLAWSLFELAKFRHKDANRQVLSEEFRIAELAVEIFREAEPLDAPGLGDALYLYADRMLELDENQEAATYAEESVMYFQEAASKDPKYALDLIFSLSLASACLACTIRDDAAFEHAKQAVEVQRGRQGAGDPQYDAHLRKLLMDVVFRATEMDRSEDATPWYEELQRLGGSGGTH